jgi:murein DD-endopeptidase MepM/ murein hydrolase activator NlpD
LPRGIAPAVRMRGGTLTIGALAAAAVLPAAAGAAGGTGGASASPAPSVSAVRCLASCAGTGAVRAGSRLQISGRALGAVTRVRFTGGAGASDDALAKPAKATATVLQVVVPKRARTGRLRLEDAWGARSKLSKPVVISTAKAPAALSVPAGASGAIDVAVAGRKVFFDAAQPAQVTFTVKQDRPLDVAVELIRESDGGLVGSWALAGVAPGTPQTVRWDGMGAGKLQPEGRYRFRVTARAGDTVVASTAQSQPAATDPASFLFLRHRFPVKGQHTYGDGAGRFGAARDGHVHEGQDVFAACGTPLLAARGGTVKLRKYQDRAGNYVVIDGEQTDVDYAYMHLRDVALVAKDERVRTGQLIGYVGDTGDANGCHLHFELWSGPGWYTGGSPFDPLPSLRAWDRDS